MLCSCRNIFLFIQETIADVTTSSPENGMKLYLEVALVADKLAALNEEERSDFAAISYELLSQAYTIYEESIGEIKRPKQCIESLCGTLLACSALTKEEYEGFATKTTQFSAKILRKPDQCQLVSLCAYLFYPAGAEGEMKCNNPQRALECLQRSLKLADTATASQPSNVKLFVDLLEHYIFFFEMKNPVITHAYITGLVALTKEHISSREGTGEPGVQEAKKHLTEVVQYLKGKKSDETTSELFAPIDLGDLA